MPAYVPAGMGIRGNRPGVTPASTRHPFPCAASGDSQIQSKKDCRLCRCNRSRDLGQCVKSVLWFFPAETHRYRELVGALR